MMFLDCPAAPGQQGAGCRCGLPAEVRCRFTMRSTGGPLESVMIRCAAGHCFSGPIEFLIPDSTGTHDPGAAGSGSGAGRDSLHRGPDGHRGAPTHRYCPAAPECKDRRPSTAPAYYLGRPAAVWIAAARPRRRHIAARYLSAAEACIAVGRQCCIKMQAATPPGSYPRRTWRRRSFGRQ